MIKNSIIIPVFGNEHLVHALLDTLIPTIDEYCEIIIVDDGFADMKIDSATLPKEVVYLSNPTNQGYSSAVNNGIGHSTGEYITTINSDILLAPNWLVETRKYFEENPDTGMLGAKLVYPTNNRVMHAGIFFGKGFAFNGFRMSLSENPLVNETIEVQALCDALATMPKKSILDVGKYDETYFTSVEDLEMCFRLNKIGLKNIYHPKIVGYHKTAASKEHRYKTVVEDEKKLFEKWDLHIKDDSKEIFEKSIVRGIGSNTNLPTEAYIVNLNRKNPQATLDAFITCSGVKPISIFDFTHYVSNTPRYEQKTTIDLLDILPFSHLNLKYPIIYIVDLFVSLNENHYWQKNRYYQKDLVFDYAFNLFFLEDVIDKKI